MPHLADCPLSQPCREQKWTGKHRPNIFNKQRCAACDEVCICERLRAHGKRLAEEAQANPENVSLLRQIMGILENEGADSEQGWHSWRCFDKDRYPGPCGCTKEVANDVLHSVVLPFVESERKRVLTEARQRLEDECDEARSLAAIDRLIEQEES